MQTDPFILKGAVKANFKAPRKMKMIYKYIGSGSLVNYKVFLERIKQLWVSVPRICHELEFCNEKKTLIVIDNFDSKEDFCA